MDNLSQHNLDNLFRESSEMTEFEYRPDAWAALDEQLDRRDRKRALLWWSAAGMLVLLLIGATAFYVGKAKAAGAKSVNPAIETEVRTPDVPTAAVETTETETTAVTSVKTDTPPAVREEITTATASKNATTQPKYRTPISAVPVQENPAQTTDENNTADSVFDTENAITTVPASVLVQTEISPVINGTALLPLPEKAIETTVPTAKIVKNTETLPRSGYLSFGIYGSSEFSNVALEEDAMAGYRFGVRADYNFLGKFSAGVGLALSKKRYCTAGREYTAKPGFWTDGVAPTTVLSSCRIIEIPVELRWFANGTRRDGFFVGAGVNTYLMNLEKYDFSYDEDIAGSIDKWEERGTNHHPFGIGTFTVGYQKTINGNLSLQFAPYVHLPLTGIGQGAVSLQSAGLNIAVQWQK